MMGRPRPTYSLLGSARDLGHVYCKWEIESERLLLDHFNIHHSLGFIALDWRGIINPF